TRVPKPVMTWLHATGRLTARANVSSNTDQHVSRGKDPYTPADGSTSPMARWEL
ncbi:hypothetical protein A2U01_0085863, partial [Trifolium medium]|nr:hypothetical protein [Trifolium medium]